MFANRINVVVLASVLMAIGCTPKPQTTLDLLQVGSSKACVAPDVEAQVIEAVQPSSFFARKGKATQSYPHATFIIDDVLTHAFKKKEQTITCRASLGLSLDGKKISDGNRIYVAYDVQPSLTKPGQIIVSTTASSVWKTVRLIFHAYGIE